MNVIDLTKEPIYVTRGACPDCPFLPHRSTKITPDLWQRAEQQALERQVFFECTSVTLARYQGKRMPYNNCCYAFFYQHWQDLPELQKAIEEQRIRYLDITGWMTLSESHCVIWNIEQPLLTGYDGLPVCTAQEWEEHGDK